MTLSGPDRDYASWLEIDEDAGIVHVRMVGRWGHARVLPQASREGGRIRFVSPRGAEGGTRTDMVFEGEQVGEELRGRALGPDGAHWTWRAKRAPALRRNPNPRWGEPMALLEGGDLSRWRAIDPAAAAWTLADGTLVSPGKGTDLRTRDTFGDFRLHLEFLCARGANSGVYLRGRYEVQIEDDAEPEGPSQRTGAVYGFIAPRIPAHRVAGAWHAYDITLVGRTVTVVLDGVTLIDRQEIPGITGGALDSDEGAPGPIVLQGSETGQVAFRNIRIQKGIE